jgi:hypothetical protein
MENAVLIQMANQITAFWSPYPKAEALESIARHIHSAWEPRMRDQMKTIIENGGQGLSPQNACEAGAPRSQRARRQSQIRISGELIRPKQKRRHHSGRPLRMFFRRHSAAALFAAST